MNMSVAFPEGLSEKRESRPIVRRGEVVRSVRKSILQRIELSDDRNVTMLRDHCFGDLWFCRKTLSMPQFDRFIVRMRAFQAWF
jgi:hypothetical protein